MKNSANIKFLSLSENESFARMCVASFIAPLNPTIEEIADIKTAVSEAVTNAIVHGYPEKIGQIEMRLKYENKTINIEIMDDGVGIKDVEKARRPFYTTCSDGTRSGMGFTVMESFMDQTKVVSAVEEGTRVVLIKKLGGKK
ncbi:MAG: anti-sigma F factor [Clostridiales bacterium]|nr:anti-sigma F factor [Clostridiales bacterium]